MMQKDNFFFIGTSEPLRDVILSSFLPHLFLQSGSSRDKWSSDVKRVGSLSFGTEVSNVFRCGGCLTKDKSEHTNIYPNKMQRYTVYFI